MLFESGGLDTEYVIREAAIGKPPPCVLSIAGWVEKSGGQTHGNGLGRDQEGCPEYLDEWILVVFFCVCEPCVFFEVHIFLVSPDFVLIRLSFLGN